MPVKTSNKALGNAFEVEFCDLLYDNGFWVHNLAQNASGQPADVIAVYRGKPFLIDCKVCSSNGFKMSRWEENQQLAMQKFYEAGGYPWLALKMGNRVYMLPYWYLKSHQVNLNQYAIMMSIHIFLFDEWLAKCRSL